MYRTDVVRPMSLCVKVPWGRYYFGLEFVWLKDLSCAVTSYWRPGTKWYACVNSKFCNETRIKQNPLHKFMLSNSSRVLRDKNVYFTLLCSSPNYSTIMIPSGFINYYIVGFEALTAVITTRSNLRFCGATQHDTKPTLCLLPASGWLLVCLNLHPWRRRWFVPPKVQWTFTGLYCVTSHKEEVIN
jgi:hypothetical protein